MSLAHTAIRVTKEWCRNMFLMNLARAVRKIVTFYESVISSLAVNVFLFSLGVFKIKDKRNCVAVKR